MRTKEVEEAINQLIVDKNFVLAGCSTAIIDINNIETVLSYIEELEDKIETCTDNGTKIISTAFIKHNFIPKDKIRDMQRLREFELQQEYKDFEEDAEWKTYKKILGE